MSEFTDNIDGFDLDYSISATNRGLQLIGKVCPFMDPFHSVKFGVNVKVLDRDGASDITHKIGFGGNTFEGYNADRMVGAAQVASKLATRLAGLASDLINANNAAYAITKTLTSDDIEKALLMVLLTPVIDTKIGERENWNHRKLGQKDNSLADAIIRHESFDTVFKVIEECATLSNDDFESKSKDFKMAFDIGLAIIDKSRISSLIGSGDVSPILFSIFGAVREGKDFLSLKDENFKVAV